MQSINHRNVTKEELITSLKTKVLKSSEIESALRVVDRRDFIPEESYAAAYDDSALSIGHGQTISQPYTVVFMLELLGVKAGETVLDVGSGSGWQSALLAYLVGKGGKVYAVEIVPALCAFGQRNVSKYPELAKHITMICQDASSGVAFPSGRKLDRVIAAASVTQVPRAWRGQLRVGGVLVYPKKGSIWVETKVEEGTFTTAEYPGFEFVPYVTKDP